MVNRERSIYTLGDSMRKVKMLTTMASPKGVTLVGGEVTVSDDQADDLVKGKYAVYVDSPEIEVKPIIIETTSFAPAEKAVLPKPIKRKR